MWAKEKPSYLAKYSKIGYVRKIIDHWCSEGPENPNPGVHHSSEKLGKASFPTGTVNPRVGILLSPLDTNAGFSLSEPRHEKTNILVSDLVRHKPGCTPTEDG